jgi:general secretion pathway protein D
MAECVKLSKIKRSVLVVVLLVFFSSLSLFGQLIKEMSFVDKPIVDILFALGAVGQKTIIPDDTVHGNANYYIYNMEFDKALKVFLDTYKLYLNIDGGVYYVSKVRVDYSPDIDKVTIDAEEVNMRMVVDAISKQVKKTILYDTLPTILLTIHQKNIGIGDLLNVVIAPAPDYKLETYPTHFYIKSAKTPAATIAPNINQTGNCGEGLHKTADGLYCISKSHFRFKDMIYDLFRQEQREVQILLPRDIMIDETLNFSGKTFEQMLRLILEQANADFDVNNNIYYIFEVAQRDIAKKLKTTMIIQLKYVTAQDLQRLFPPDLGSSQFYRIDTNENFVILNGSIEEITPIKTFIDEFDKPLLDSKYYRFDLNFIKATNIFNYLPEPYKFQRIIQVPESNSFVMPLSKEKKTFMDNYLKIVDKPVSSFEVHLKYIKSDDLLKKLPPSVIKDDIIDTQDPSIIFFKGTREKYNAFRRELDIFDQPVPQIRYQVLVISYSEGSNLSWGTLGTNQSSVAEATYVGQGVNTSQSFIGVLGGLLKVNFDIPNILGWTLASNLNVALGSNDAKVITDTMINSLSGEKISFSDRQVLSYVTTSTSTTTGTTVAGPTQSIEIGFKLGIDGWASGDQMITMKVDVDLSSAGSQTLSSTEGVVALPSTLNKTISTKTRTRSGEPLKIGGLLNDNQSSVVDKFPLLGDIPVIGYLFRRENDTDTKSEIVIYILPHIVYSAEEVMDTGRRMDQLYRKFFNPSASQSGNNES